MRPFIKSDNTTDQTKNKKGIKEKHLFDELVGTSKQLSYTHYCQNTSIGCGISSFLMALSGLQPGYIPSSEDEQKRVKKLRHMRLGIPLFEIIKMIDSYGFKMQVFYEGRINEQDINDPLVANYNNCINYMSNKGHLINKENIIINMPLIMAEIKKNNYVLINGTTGEIAHMRLCVGYNGDKLLIADPLISNLIEYDNKKFYENCNPPYGRWFISLSKE